MESDDLLAQSSDQSSGLGSSTTTNGANTAPQVARANALSSKIQSVLASSYSDAGIRDALDTLDARGVLSNQETRRNLRLNVQREIIDRNGEIIHDFGQVADQLKSVGNALEKLQHACAEMRKHVSAARMETAPMLDEADALMDQKAQVESKQLLLTAVKNHFTLSENELAALTSSAQPVSDQFFIVLVKAKAIHKDCQVLLGAENQRLGLDILDQTTRHLNAAYPKLYRWIQREFKTLDLENPQISTSIRRALRVLAEKPTLFQSCLDAFAESREHSLSDAFHSALTGTSRDKRSMPAKPLEITAHEPLRYIGDMLAWAHSATVSEREALEGLFISEGDEIAKSIREGLESEPWSRSDDEEAFDGKTALNQLLNRDSAGIARLLRQRVEQVIHSHEETVLAYKIANLIGFYRNIFLKFLDPKSNFIEALVWLENSATNQFRKTMQYQVTSVQNEKPSLRGDLAAPDFLDEAVDEFKLLLKSYDTSVASNRPVESSFPPVLGEAIDPFLDICKNLADATEQPQASIFMINCLLAVKAPLALFTFTVKKITDLDSAIERNTARLVDSQHQYFLTASGTQSLFSAVTRLSESEAHLRQLLSLHAFAPEALVDTSQQLDAFLPSALMDAAENIKQLQSSTLVHDITSKAAVQFCADFEFVESRMDAADALKQRQVNGNDEHAPTALRDLFPRTSEEIRILLS